MRWQQEPKCAAKSEEAGRTVQPEESFSGGDQARAALVTPSSSNPLRRGGPGAPEPGRGQAQRGHHGDGQGGCVEGLGQRRGRAGSWEMYRTIENTKLV